MAEFVLNKLVLDGVLDRMLADGQKPVFRFLEGDELLRALLEKIKEEADEALTVFDDTEKRDKEVEGVLRVSDAIAKTRGFTFGVELDDDGKGGFEKGIYIERVQVPDDSEWTAYYRREPRRFPEVGVDELDRLVIPSFQPGIYRHYRTHNDYEALGVGCHSENLEFYVVYRPLYSHDGKPGIWLRPFDMFTGEVTVGTETMPRFEWVAAS